MDGKMKDCLNEKARCCGARTRAGTPCRKSPMRNGRCANHDGKSLSGIAHPNYKHGRYTELGRLIYRREVAERKRARRLRRSVPEILGTIARIEFQKGRPISAKEFANVIKHINEREAEIRTDRPDLYSKNKKE